MRDFYPSSGPRREAKDGIKARSATFGKAWWSRHWIEALSSFGWSSRLQRGRSYARSGQVLDYRVEAGRVTAKVQGSRRAPYVVSIALKAIEAAAWERVLDALSAQAGYAAELLSGQMPQEIDTVFREAGVALLPARSGDLETSCSCPDWANPCKHVAAVHYILAEALDADPFILTALRGRTRDQVLLELSKRRGDGGSVSSAAPAELDEPLRADDFWGAAHDLSMLDMGFAAPPVHASVMRRLGAPAAWTTDSELIAVFGPLLRQASEEALRAGGQA